MISPVTYIVAWLALLILLGLSTASAFLHLGRTGPLIPFAIAATQAAIIFLVFMRLRGRPSLKWIFAGAGFSFYYFYLYRCGCKVIYSFKIVACSKPVSIVRHCFACGVC